MDGCIIETAFPSHGLRKCILESTFDVLFDACGATVCPCPYSPCCFVDDPHPSEQQQQQQQHSTCKPELLMSAKNWLPLMTCVVPSVATINAKIESCYRKHQLDVGFCRESLKSCAGCQQSDISDRTLDAICTRYYTESGISITDSSLTSGDSGSNSSKIDFDPNLQNSGTDHQFENYENSIAHQEMGIPITDSDEAYVQFVSDRIVATQSEKPVSNGLAVCPHENMCISVPKPIADVPHFSHGIEKMMLFHSHPFIPTISAKDYARASICHGADDPLCSGCTSMHAQNYDHLATFNNGSCKISWTSFLFSLANLLQSQVYLAVISVIFILAHIMVCLLAFCSLPLVCCQRLCSANCKCWKRSGRSSHLKSEEVANRERDGRKSKSAKVFEVPPDLAKSVQMAYKEQRRLETFSLAKSPSDLSQQQQHSHHMALSPDMDRLRYLALPVSASPTSALPPQSQQTLVMSTYSQSYGHCDDDDDRSLDELTTLSNECNSDHL